MINSSFVKRLAPAVGCLVLGFSFASQAGTSGAQPASSCQSVRLAAWFDKQRQLTDGNVDPFAGVAMPAPVDCGAMHAGKEESATEERKTAEARKEPRMALQTR
jgi:hypothetical protein